MTIIPDPDIESVKELLIRCHLPASDITPDSPVRFFGCGNVGEIVGVVGLESYGRVGLLRSLAVDATRRGEGIGNRLVAYLENVVRDNKLESVYLLTDTAEKFFVRLGFVHCSRDRAPDEIRKTEEFRCLCPESAEFMVKHLDSVGQRSPSPTPGPETNCRL